MACPRDENLIRFVYDEAAVDEMAQIQRHVESCEPCQEDVASIRALEEVLPGALRVDSNGEPPEEECPDAMTLACYLDGSLFPQERQRVEAHLAHCRSCRDELVATAESAHGTKNDVWKTPVHLLDQAVQVGHAPTLSPDATPVEKFQRWFEPLLSRPGWALAGAGACAAVVLTVYLANQAYKGQPETAQTTPFSLGINKLSQPNKPRSREIVSEARLDLTPDLKQALIDYDPTNSIESQKKLFAIIKKTSPPITVDKIKNVEIEPNLLIAIASVSDLGGRVRLRLYEDGFLVIGTESEVTE